MGSIPIGYDCDFMVWESLLFATILLFVCHHLRGP